MTITTTYTAEDGTVFDNHFVCVMYEESCKKQRVQQCQETMRNLDNEIWKKYFPETTEDMPDAPLEQVYLWLKNDILAILAYHDELNADPNDIFSMIEASEFGAEILEKYINKDAILDEVSIRRDYATALESVTNGRALSGRIGYAFGKKDLCKLAKLHKENKFREKIEDLLEDCNFHYESSKFSSGEYDEVLKEE